MNCFLFGNPKSAFRNRSEFRVLYDVFDECPDIIMKGRAANVMS